MTEKKTAIVLGGTSPHAILVQKLKVRGYYVVLVDYLDNPPAKQFADEHIQASTLDKDIVLQISVEKNADIVISTCIDQANSVCCYVAEKLNLPHPYSYETSLNVTDKGLMKRIMMDNNIPTSSYIIVEDTENIDWTKVTFPAVVKPVDCNSSKGVRRVDSVDEAKFRIAEAIELSRTRKAIIEGFNKGEEIQVDCVAAENGVEVVLTRQKNKISNSGNEMVLQSRGSIIPAPLDETLNYQAQAIAKKIASSFGLTNTPFFYQAIVTEDGIKVLEFAPRIGGGLSYYVIKELAGFDVIEAAIDSFIGKPIEHKVSPLEKCYSTNLIYMMPGVFDHIEGLHELKDEGLAYEVFTLKAKGTIIDSDMRSSNRVAAFILEANTFEELALKEEKAINMIEIRDNKGNALLNRSIYNF